MYAALIVSIWSELEHFLKNLVRTCYIACGEHKKIPYNIEAINKEIERETGIQIDNCRGYNTVNAIRILNNSYKHSDGYYHPEKCKPYSQINKSLLKKWRIKEDRKIEYSKLPIEKIVLSLNAFCTNILKKVEPILENRSWTGMLTPHTTPHNTPPSSVTQAARLSRPMPGSGCGASRQRLYWGYCRV